VIPQPKSASSLAVPRVPEIIRLRVCSVAARPREGVGGDPATQVSLVTRRSASSGNYSAESLLRNFPTFDYLECSDENQRFPQLLPSPAAVS